MFVSYSRGHAPTGRAGWYFSAVERSVFLRSTAEHRLRKVTRKIYGRLWRRSLGLYEKNAGLEPASMSTITPD